MKAKTPKQKPADKPARGLKDTMKWADFARYYFDKKSDTYDNAEASAIKAGFSPSYAATITTRSGYDKVRQGLAGALEELGVDDKYLAGGIKKLIDAKKIVKHISKDIEIEELDSRAINYGLTHAINVRGDKAPDKVDVTASQETLEALAKLKSVITVRPAGSKK